MDTKEIVAVKKALQDKNFKSRELDILKELVHPNIINLKHFFYSKDDEDKSKVYLNLVTEFLPEVVPRVCNFYQK